MTLLFCNAGFHERVVFSRVLLQEEHIVIFSPSLEETFRLIEKNHVDLFITREDSLPSFNSTITEKPDLRIALMAASHAPAHSSNLEHKALMKLPNTPEKSDALTLMKKLSHAHRSLAA